MQAPTSQSSSFEERVKYVVERYHENHSNWLQISDCGARQALDAKTTD
jgi:hypothetical protein